MSDIGNPANQGNGSQLSPEDDMDRYLTNKASYFRYLPTPDIASSVRDRLQAGSAYKHKPIRQQRQRPRSAWAAAALVLVLTVGIMLAVPQTRAILVGVYTNVVRIFKPEPGPVPVPVPVPVPQEPTPSPTPSWSDKLFGETDLGNAQLQLNCKLNLPTYPADSGLPDHAYFQTVNSADVVLLLWNDRSQPGKPRMALYVVTRSSLVTGIIDTNGYVQATVRDQHAWWTSGPQLFEVYDSAGIKKLTKSQLVDGNVLIWKEPAQSGTACGNLTYRLETGLSMEESVKIANSLAPSKTMPTPISTNTPPPTTTPISPASALNLAGETSLYKLADEAGFRIKIPVLTARPDLVQPGKVFLQDLGSPAVIMAWFVPDRTDDLQLVLYQIKGKDNLAANTAANTTLLEQATVHGNPAQWVIGPHPVYTIDGNGGQILEAKSFLNGGRTLVWEEDGITYRLETRGTLQEAIEIAEALK